ncbi:MAG: coenzyme F420-0:L-glutamate ligase [Patescibacteria group bacterium]
MHIVPVKTRLVKPGDDIVKVIFNAVPKLREGSIVAFTSKVVSLSEGRFVRKKPGVTLEALVRREAEKVWLSEHCFLVLKDGLLAPNAGIDESNAFGGFILWPKDAYKSAMRLHSAFKEHYHVRRLGVLITDSWTMPLRHGVVGIALGYHGFDGQKNYVGKKDLMGRRLQMTKVSAADCIASAAVLVMGEGDERTPIAVIEDAPVRFTSRSEKGTLNISPRDDVYRPILKV